MKLLAFAFAFTAHSINVHISWILSFFIYDFDFVPSSDFFCALPLTVWCFKVVTAFKMLLLARKRLKGQCALNSFDFPFSVFKCTHNRDSKPNQKPFLSFNAFKWRWILIQKNDGLAKCIHYCVWQTIQLQIAKIRFAFLNIG